MELESKHAAQLYVNALPPELGKQLDLIFEQIGNVQDLPLWLTRLLLTTHLVYGDRESLTLFLLGNRCPPDLIVDWYIARKMLWDMSARMDVASVIKGHKAGKKPRKKVFIPNWRSCQEIGHTMVEMAETFPSDAFMHLEGYRWDQSVAMLENKAFAQQLPFRSQNTLSITVLPGPALDPDSPPSPLMD